jgi:tetratricopeptide (TPR) repeat protein
MVLRLYREADGTLRNELRQGDVVIARAEGLTFPPGTAPSLKAFLDAREAAPLQAWAQAEWRLLEADLAELGRHLGSVLFAGDVGEELAAWLQRLGDGETIDLVYEADAELLALPVEAARLAQRNGAVIALEPGVHVRRRPSGIERQPQPALAHPLKILVGVAAPTHGVVGEVLDWERELHTILAAVEPQARLGGAEVRVLEVTSIERLGQALERDAYHVVHLSGHGRPGKILMDDEDGGAVEVDASALVRVLGRAGVTVPLVVLSACHSAGAGSDDLGGFAASLVSEGLDRVVTMQSRVTDRYATAFAAGLYSHLASQQDPVVGEAIAQTRQELEQKRLAMGGTAGGFLAAEYATATLLAVGEDCPIVDHGAEARPLRELPVHQVHPLFPQLGVDEFIDRRSEMREVLRVLRDDAQFVDQAGRMPGVVVTGVGGLGKSALAGRVAARLVEEGWALAVHQGELRLDGIAGAVAEGLGGWAARLATQHTRHPQTGSSAAVSPTAEDVRAAVKDLTAAADDGELLPLLTRTLRRFPILLVLDDFEQNLDTGGTRFSDEGVDAQLGVLVATGGLTKVLVTCRYPIPGFEHRLHEVGLPPLSSAEIRKDFLRLPGLRALKADEQQLVQRVVGGHPRVLELLDALLRQGQGRQAALGKLATLASQADIRLRDSRRDVPKAIVEAVALGVQDVLLDELLGLLDPVQRQALDLVAPSNLPMSAGDVAAVLDAADAAADVCQRLANLSLLARVGGDRYWVHRWIAQALRQRDPATYGTACHALAAYRLELARTDPTYVNEEEALRNWLDAQAWDEATDLMLALGGSPFAQYQLAVSALATEVLQVLPPEHANFGAIADLEARADLACGFTTKAHRRYLQLAGLLASRAEAEPDRADFQRDLSISYNRLGDLARAMGLGEDAVRLFTQALDIARRLAEAEPGRVDFQRDLSLSYNKLGDLAVAMGRAEEAVRFFSDALDTTHRVAETEPDRAELQRDLSVSYERLGDLAVAMGLGEEAVCRFSHALDIRRHLAEAEPDRADLQRDLSVSYERLGDLAVAMGRGEEAARLFSQTLDIRRHLAEAEPERIDFQRDLSVSYERLGDLAVAKGHGEEAARLFSQSLDIARRLAEAEPERVDFQRDLSVCYQRLGDLVVTMGRGEEAARLFSQALDIYRRLAEAEPDRADFQRDLSVSYERLGDLAMAMGRGEEAARLFSQALDIRRRLAEAEPERVDFQRDLSVSYNKLGDLAATMGHAEEAARLFPQSLDIARRLAEAEPGRADFQRDLSVCYERLGDLARAMGRGEEAAGLFSQALDLRRRLAEAEPDRTDFQHDLSVSYSKLGDLARAMGRGQEAALLFSQALDIRCRLAEAEPDRVGFQRDLSVSYSKLGELARAMGRAEEAAGLFSQALDIRRRLAKAEPSRADFQRDLSISYERLGDLARAAGRSEEAAGLFSQALDIRHRLAEAEPDRVDFQRDLSVSYNKLGNLAVAMDRAEEAARLFSQALDIRRRLAAQQPASADAAVDIAISLVQIASFSVDPAHERREAQAILAHLQAEGRLPLQGERLLAKLENEPAGELNS